MPHLVLVSQVYVPDPASVGQHMADVAEEMAQRGWRVTVLTSNRGYDNPSEKFPSRETLRGVEVRRLPFSSLGKKTIVHRLVGQAFFCAQALLWALFLRRPDCILVTTSPPMGGVVGWLAGLLRRVPLVFWGMDLNPDQAIAQGVVTERSLPARVFDWFNRRLLRRASTVIALDRFMAERLERKVPLGEKFLVLPPWPMEGYLERIEHDENPFREEHGLRGKFVVMYSGNHSPVHPLDTILEASRAFRDDDRIRFLFIGGGKGKAAVDDFIEAEAPPNVVSLPYQPLDRIKYSLSAADVHLVSMGDAMVGCVHPCKFYGALALEIPVLLLGPEECHVGDLLREHEVGWHVEHGDVEGAGQVIREAAALPAEDLRRRGQTGRDLVDRELGKEILCGRFCDALEGSAQGDSGKGGGGVRVWVACLLWLVSLLLAAGVLYLSWTADSRMRLVEWIPEWLARWADSGGTVEDLRTGVPLAAAGFLFAVTWRASGWQKWFVGGVGLAVVLVAVAEVGQFFLPARTPHWADVLWGIGGAVAGAVVAGVVGLFWSLVAPKRASAS